MLSPVEMEAAMNTSYCEKTLPAQSSAGSGLPGLLTRPVRSRGARSGAWRARLVAVLASVPIAHALAETPYQVEWIRQLGTSSTEWGASVAVDGAGRAFLSGYTHGALGGSNFGSTDAFLAKYSAMGALLWIRQLGTGSGDRSHSVAVDGAGSVFISGHTNGSLGGPNSGAADAFIAKYSTSGNLLWTRQIGTSSYDFAVSIAIDGSGNAFICGDTDGNFGGPNAGGTDAFIAKYSASGVRLWTRQIGTDSGDNGWGVAVNNAGNAFICGPTSGSLGGPNAGGSDAFIAKYSASGVLLWTRQFGTDTDDKGWAVAVDGTNNAFICGTTGGTNVGEPIGLDGFIAKYSDSGALLWARQIGTSTTDTAYSVAVDDAGNAIIGGFTSGSLGGSNVGSHDAYLAKYSASGSLLWTRQIGTSSSDNCQSVAVDGLGNAFMSGRTVGSLGGPHVGFGDDAFIVKFSPAGCPADVTGNGLVDIADLLAVISALGTSGNGGPADVNGDNTVNNLDLIVVISAWGTCV
jgi:hypothetical protein